MKRPLRFAWLPVLLAAMASLGSMRAACQGKLPELDYLIRYAGPVDHYQEKRVYEVLAAHEPGLGVWLDVPNQQVKVRTHLVIHREALQAEFQRGRYRPLEHAGRAATCGERDDAADDPGCDRKGAG